MLEIQGVTVQFGGVRPLNDVTLTVSPGVTGLIGPNGAGKTTLLNVLSGFVRPVAGTVSSHGERLDAMAPHRRAQWGLRRSFQAEQLVLTLSVRDNVRLVVENIGAPGSDVERVLDAVGLTEPDRRAGVLSMLERRLLELARAMVGHPRVVLLDEPGAGLAEADARQLEPLIHELADPPGTVVLLIDHDMDLVQNVCRDLAVLDFGQLIATGPAAQVLANPVVAKAYLGTEEVA
ncbi:MAG TPA: ATP-binding cassette domain-containing protein [Kineosporiaceae bacterium]|nr:ATP-binding cassette domain-containing protein [Kineosporiaceae bacterium]